MNILIIIAIAIAAIITIVLLAALFTKSEYAVERESIINQPAKQVFDYISHLRNMDQYNKWVMTDSTMRKDYKGIDGTVGFTYGWDSDNKQAGEGEQEIINIEDGRKIEIRITFKRPFAGIANTYMLAEPATQRSSTLKWDLPARCLIR